MLSPPPCFFFASGYKHTRGAAHTWRGKYRSMALPLPLPLPLPRPRPLPLPRPVPLPRPLH